MLGFLTITVFLIAVIAIGIVTGLIGFIIANWFAVLSAIAIIYIVRNKGKRNNREVN